MYVTNTNSVRVFCYVDEQERVQKKTFVNWINSYLCQVTYAHINILFVHCIFIRIILMPFYREYRR